MQRRDGGCIAPLLDPDAGPCRDRFGVVVDRFERRAWTLSHVSSESTHAKRAPSDPAHLVVECAGHHLGTGPQGGYVWATAHREEERAYLRGFD